LIKKVNLKIDKKIKNHKMNINKLALKNALKSLNGIVRPNNVLPITESVKFEIAESGEQRLVVTDLETSMFITVEATDPMETCINYFQLLKVCDSFQGELLDFELTENSVSIRCEKAKVTLPTEVVDNYPKTTILEGEPILSNFDFTPIGEAVRFSGNDEIRPSMTGVCIDISNGTINIVATNANILYLNCVAQTEHEKSETVVPKNAAKKIGSLTDASMLVSGHNIQFTQGELIIQARAIDHQFPQYRAVIPTEQKGKALLNTELFKKNIDAASKFASNSTKTLVLDILETELTVSASDIDYAIDYTNTIGCVADLPIKIGFNSEFTKLLIDAITASTVELTYTESNRAIVVQEGSKTLLIMPVIIQ
jgi:DNA polymerase-3 subunit beta